METAAVHLDLKQGCLGAGALATVKQLDEKLRTALAHATEGRVRDSKPKVPASTAFVFATEKLCMALARAAERQVNKFNLQELTNTAWAFESVNQSDEKLFTAWALATGKQSDEKLFAAWA